MVSFSCENCGDVLTKKKLDAHHRQCRGSSFTCLDCMTHFRDTRYREHTSCVSEEQKYQGALYKEKPQKHSKKSVKKSDSTTHAPLKAYVEDAPDPDPDTENAIAIVNAPPAAPTPPAAVPQPSQPINVFDFLVSGDTPKASKTSLEEAKEPVKMGDHAPPVSQEGPKSSPREEAVDSTYDSAYEKRGFTYGTDPVPVSEGRPMVEYFTPAPKYLQNGSKESLDGVEDSAKKSTDKKRKRFHVEDLDLTAARRPSQEPDHVMEDAPLPILHSGLTGGLDRLLSKSNFPPTPDYSNGDPDPPSPVKRIKTIAPREKDRGRKASSGTLVKVRQRRTSDESRPRKHRRSHHSPEHHRRHGHHDRHDRPKRKAIEYHAQPSTEDSQQQLVVFKNRADLFTSFVTKGPDSEQGYSMHKALKRYHRERGEQGLGLDKVDDEKELFRALRLRRNDRGEVVIFF